MYLLLCKLFVNIDDIKRTCIQFIRFNNNNNNPTFILRLKHAMQTQRNRYIGKTHDQHLEACCRGISSCWEGKILISHRVIGIATNTSLVLNWALVTYIMMIADVGLPDAV